MRLEPKSGADGVLAISTMTVAIKTAQGEQEFPVENAEDISYDAATRKFRAVFRRNDARVKSLDGVISAEAREFYQTANSDGYTDL